MTKSEGFVRKYIKCPCGVKVKRHIYKDGARYHVISYSTTGRRCSEKDCEINHKCKE